MARCQRPPSPSAAPEPSHHRAVVASHPEHGVHPVRVCHHQLARLGEAHRASRVFTQLVLAGHKATSGSDEPSSLTGHAFHLHLHHTSGSEESVSRSFAASQHDRVQRRRINQTAPPRACIIRCVAIDRLWHRRKRQHRSGNAWMRCRRRLRRQERWRRRRRSWWRCCAAPSSVPQPGCRGSRRRTKCTR